MDTAASRRRRLPVRLADVGLLARPDLPRRGHPHEGQRQHRRDERLARLRLAARAAGRCCSTSRRASCRRSSATRRRRARRRRARGRGGDARPLAADLPPLPARREDGRDRGGAFLGVAPLVGRGAARRLDPRLRAHALRVGRVDHRPRPRSPFWAWLFGYPWPVIAFGGAAGLGVVVLHRANIAPALARRGEPLRPAAPTERRYARSQSLRTVCAAGAVAAAVELGAQLADRAVALGDDLVRVDRLEVDLAREDEVVVAELGVARRGRVLSATRTESSTKRGCRCACSTTNSSSGRLSSS